MRPLLARLVPLAALAAAGAAFAGWTAWSDGRKRPFAALPTPPAPRFAERVAASGLIEPDGGVAAIGPTVAGTVAEVVVAEGQRVAAGDALVRLDATPALAGVAIAEQAVAAARARLARLEAMPREDDAGAAAARVAVADARLASAHARRVRADALSERDALSADERDARVAAETIAAAEAAAARAELAQARLPAWPPDLAAARAEIAVEEARLAAARLDVDRCTVVAPRAGTVLAVATRVGEWLQPGAAAISLGDGDHLVVRLEIDEAEAGRLVPGASGEGWIRGDAGHRVALAFIRIVPLARARAALPGAPDDRIDGRAVQALYRVVDPPPAARPGLMVEADLDASPRAATEPR